MPQSKDLVKDGLKRNSQDNRGSGANDGENRWEFRRDLSVEVVRQFDPDLLGDWILHSDQLAAIHATIDRTRGPGGRCPSDHDAVTAVLQWMDER